MKLADILIIGIILIAVSFAVYKIIRNKKEGKCNCGCSGGNCDFCKEKKKSSL